jgi:hypothetical protein
MGVPLPNEIVVVLQCSAGEPTIADACAALEGWARVRGVPLRPQPFEDPGARRFAYLAPDPPVDLAALLGELRAMPYVEAVYVKPGDEVP